MERIWNAPHEFSKARFCPPVAAKITTQLVWHLVVNWSIAGWLLIMSTVKSQATNIQALRHEYDCGGPCCNHKSSVI